MHRSAYEYVERQIAGLTFGTVLEVGSRNVNGSVRPLFKAKEYIGVDMEEGDGVDSIQSAHDLLFRNRYFDCVVSTEVIEHDDMFWVSMSEMGRVLKKGGLLIVTARGNGFPNHDHPRDYYRFMPDAGKVLLDLAECDVVDISVDEHPNPGILITGRKR